MRRGEERRGDMCRLFVHPSLPFLHLSSSGQRRKTLNGLFFLILFSNKEAKQDHYAWKRMCSLQNISRLGGEIYRNKPVSPCFANLDPGSGCGDVLSITPEVVTMLNKTSQNRGELEKHFVVCSLTCHNLASFGAITGEKKSSLWKQRKKIREGGRRKGGVSCCCPQGRIGKLQGFTGAIDIYRHL